MYAASGCPAELYATPRQTRGVQLDGASRRAQARGFALAFLRALLDLKLHCLLSAADMAHERCGAAA